MKRNRQSLPKISRALISVAVLFSAPVDAQSTWTSPSNGSWASPGNWSDGLPTIDQAVAINNAASKVVTIRATTPEINLAARRLDLSAPAGSTNTLRLDQLGDSLFQLANTFTLGAGGRLEVLNSFVQLDGRDGGNLNQLAGEIVLAGGGLSTTNSDPRALNGQPSLRIGRSGVARALVLSGDLIASDELVVGDLAGASGRLVLSNGLVRAGGVFTLGNNPGASGSVEVYGGALISTNLTARIGDDGTGTLFQSDGQILFDDVSVGRAANSDGRLSIRGGVFQAGDVSVGRFDSSQGLLEVSGGTVDLGAHTLFIGREGVGTAVLSDGLVRAAIVKIAGSGTASGKLELRGNSLTTGQLIADQPSARIEFQSGSLVVTQSTTVANGSELVIGDGIHPARLQLDGGSHTFANGIVIAAQATLEGSGTVIGTITVLPGGRNLLGTAAAIELALAPADRGFQFSFPSTVGKLYEVWAAPQLAAPAWERQSTLVGTGAALTYADPSSAVAKFFQVLVR